MKEQDRFQGAYKTTRASYKDFNNLCALWFSYGFKNSYHITKERFGKTNYFVIWKEQKPIKKIKIE